MTRQRVINPNALYFQDELRQLLRLKESTVRRELREGRLRVSKRAGRYIFLGAWILEWVEAGELKRRPAELAEAE
jgi:hypothetical protein